MMIQNDITNVSRGEIGACVVQPWRGVVSRGNNEFSPIGEAGEQYPVMVML